MAAAERRIKVNRTATTTDEATKVLGNTKSDQYKVEKRRREGRVYCDTVSNKFVTDEHWPLFS